MTQEGRGAASRKELLHDRLLRILTCADSWEAFIRQVQAAGIEVYSRGGRPYGVIQDGQKYRFSTLGIAEALETAKHQWQRLPACLQTMKSERAERARRFIRSFGYAKDMLEVVEGEPDDHGHRQLRHDRRERRYRQREERFRSFSRGDRSPDRSP